MASYIAFDALGKEIARSPSLEMLKPTVDGLKATTGANFRIDKIETAYTTQTLDEALLVPRRILVPHAAALAYEKQQLGARYVALVGYDPFIDDPTIDVETVRATIRELEADGQ